MATIASLNIFLRAKTGQFSRDMKKSSAVIRRFAVGVQAATNQIGRFARNALLAGTAAGAAFVKLAMEQEKAERMLDATLQSTGASLVEHSARLRELASEMQKATVYGDEFLLMLMSQGMNLGLTADSIGDTTKMAIGLATAMKMDLVTAMRYTALAMQGEYTILRRYIPALRQATGATEQMAIVQRVANSGWEQAQAEARTTIGQLIQLKNTIGDVAENLGDTLLPAIRMATEYLRTLADSAKRISQAELSEFIATVKSVAKWLVYAWAAPKVIAGILLIKKAVFGLMALKSALIVVTKGAIAASMASTLAARANAASTVASTLATRAKATAEVASTMATKGHILATTASTLARAAHTKATIWQTRATAANTVATNAGKVAMISSAAVIGNILVVPLVAAAAAYIYFKKVALEAAVAMKQIGLQSRTFARLNTQAKELRKTIAITTDIQERKDSLQELILVYEQLAAIEDADEEHGGVKRAEVYREWAKVATAQLKRIGEATKELQETGPGAGLAQKIDTLTKSLQLQVDTFGMTTREAQIYKLSLEGASDAAIDNVAAISETISVLEREKKALEDVVKATKKLMDDGKRVFDQTRTSLEQYENELSNLSKLLDEGAISWDTYGRAIRMAQEGLKGGVSGPGSFTTVDSSLIDIRGLSDFGMTSDKQVQFDQLEELKEINRNIRSPVEGT